MLRAKYVYKMCSLQCYNILSSPHTHSTHTHTHTCTHTHTPLHTHTHTHRRVQTSASTGCRTRLAKIALTVESSSVCLSAAITAGYVVASTAITAALWPSLLLSSDLTYRWTTSLLFVCNCLERYMYYNQMCPYFSKWWLFASFVACY